MDLVRRQDGAVARATTHVLTHTLHYGMGVFEGVRCYKTVDGPAIFRLRDHTNRFFRSAHIYGMKIPFTKDEIDAAQLACVRENKLDRAICGPSRSTGRMRWAWRPNRIRSWSPSAPGRGARISGRCDRKRHPREDVVVHAPSSEHHDVQREGRRQLHGVDPRQPGALHDGYEEAMLLDPQGFVCQGSGENVFIVRDGKLHTPELSGGALNGSRATRIITFANEHRHPRDRAAHHARRSLHRRRSILHRHRGEVTPIREYDNRTIGEGTCGPVTRKLQALFFDAVNGRDAGEAVVAHAGVTMAATKDHGARERTAQGSPVFCPNPAMPLWSSHPRVFLDVAETGEAMCPYCGTRYALAGGPVTGGH
jgi:branched-chain amino acid aminotransferase